ncbi:2-hydroxyacid dehydrogenase [Oceanobacillus jeddahense]|uniref:D-glycerate dehydrogenase n=1 Tax=Oceanobacillus jeddahense TaxID=1462527 RepID=A0ABY5JS79_9BACI|nr:D-glycerate dehydrogenase [Oceanobacillus jeddahense]UUI01931.1 D-glycerate dehydrogenase [Oceanobacillus jeddahense]
MSKPKVYITRKIDASYLESYQDQLDIRMWEKEEESVPRETLYKEVADATALFAVLSDSIDEDLLSKAPNLKVVANMAVGYDNIDLEACKKHHVTVTNTPDVLSETTADLGFSLIMSTARRIVEAEEWVKQDKWQSWAPFFFAGTDIYGKTLGIVGMGRIGEGIAKRASGFDMNIQYHNRSRKKDAEERLNAKYVSFDELLKTSDFIVTVVPHTQETDKLFNQAAFEKMKSSAIFINISRGKVVDEEALVNALKTGEIQAAGLDVFEEEPIRADHPLVGLNNTVCIPHIGSASVETRTKMVELCMDNILAVVSGKEAITPVS